MPSYKTLAAGAVGMLFLSGCADMDVRREMMAKSQEKYSGVCACPYDRDSAGRECGGRSYFTRVGASKVQCYPWNYSNEEVEEYKRRHPKKEKQ